MSETLENTTPATEFCRNFGRYKDKAIENGVIAVSSNGRAVGAYLSQREFERYQAFKRRETKVLKTDDLPQDILDQIAKSEHGVLAE